jgi:hypothetical protein
LSDSQQKEKMIKQLASVVCICKGIPLSRFLTALKECDTVSCVNSKVGSGSGGCAGERCGPRIKKLLEKKKSRS